MGLSKITIAGCAKIGLRGPAPDLQVWQTREISVHDFTSTAVVVMSGFEEVWKNITGEYAELSTSFA